jgi:hypothetical protein
MVNPELSMAGSIEAISMNKVPWSEPSGPAATGTPP